MYDGLLRVIYSLFGKRIAYVFFWLQRLASVSGQRIIGSSHALFWVGVVMSSILGRVVDCELVP